MKPNLKFLYLFAVIFPLGLLALAVIQYQNNTEKQIQMLTEKIGNVAGTSVKEEVIEISSKDLPIMPNTDIISIDRQNNDISIVLQATIPDSEIQSFYDDYLFQNGWIENTTEGFYSRENEKLVLSISEGIIKATVSRIE